MDSFKQQTSNAAMIHLKAKQDELQTLLSDIKECGLTKASECVALINNSLDGINETIKEQQGE